jgi:hypothetical protein
MFWKKVTSLEKATRGIGFWKSEALAQSDDLVKSDARHRVDTAYDFFEGAAVVRSPKKRNPLAAA